VCLPIGLKPSAASPGGAAQVLAVSLPLRSYIQFASKSGRKFKASLSVAKCQQRPLPLFAARNVMECLAGSLRLDACELDHLCPFFRFSRNISAELRGGEYHWYGADLGKP
jgi:hypothetical protein